MNGKQIEERNEQFDSAVREQFADYEPKVPHALWNRISAELDKGQATEETYIIPHYAAHSGFGKWKMAIAAAVILTLTVGTLLYTQQPSGEINITAGSLVPTDNKTTPKVESTEAMAPKVVAQMPHIEKKSTIVNPAKTIPPTQNTVIASDATIKATDISVENKTENPMQTTQEQPIEFAPVLSENKPMDVGNIPLASLNFLSTPNSLNDEITVIKSVEKKRKHGKKSDDESTKVIVIGKKYDTKPDIRFQVPVRF